MQRRFNSTIFEWVASKRENVMGVLSPIIDEASNRVLAGQATTPPRDLISALRQLGLTGDELDALRIEPRKLPIRHRLRTQQRPNARLSRRIRAKRAAFQPAGRTEEALRVARLIDHAIRVFGSATKALGWLRTVNPTLGSRRPIDLLGSETGAQAVDEALYRIDHGIFA